MKRRWLKTRFKGSGKYNRVHGIENHVFDELCEICRNSYWYHSEMDHFCPANGKKTKYEMMQV